MMSFYRRQVRAACIQSSLLTSAFQSLFCERRRPIWELTCKPLYVILCMVNVYSYY